MDYDSDVLKVWLGPMLGVVVFHPQDIEMLLSSQEHIKKSDEYKMFKPWFGNGLLISSGLDLLLLSKMSIYPFL